MSTLIMTASRDWAAVTLREMRDWITYRACGAVEPLDCCWITAGPDFDATGPFCRPCAEKKVTEIRRHTPENAARYGVKVDGGFSMEHDELQWCETCFAKLAGSPTDDGVKDELRRFEGHPPTDCEEWDDLQRAMNNFSASALTLELLCAGSPPPWDLGAKGDVRGIRAWARIAPIIIADMQRMCGVVRGGQ